MLPLNAEQVQRLQAIQQARDTRLLGDVLAGLFPDIPTRVGERYPALIAHAVQRGAAHGLSHAVCVARYLACWFMLGAEFENKPGFEWARQLLSDTRRTQGAKVFQLCRRTREMLGRWGSSGAPGMPGPQPMPPQSFDQAIAALDAALMDVGDVGSLLRGGRVALGQACDIDALDLRLASADANLFYAVQQGQWTRVPATTQPAPVTLRAGQPGAGGNPPGAAAAATARNATTDAGSDAAADATTGASTSTPTLPPRLTLLARQAGATPARLRVRTLAAQCCDVLVHPLVVLQGAQGVSEWRGKQAADITLDLYSAAPGAAPATAPAGALQPAIAVESAAQVSVLQLSSCGLREDGDALGDLQTQIAVYPAEQHLIAWRREALGELHWPEPSGGHPPAPTPRCRIERDGTALDATRWQAGLADLDRQLLAALPRLLTAWERTSGASQCSLTAAPRVLCGDAGISWGWANGGHGNQGMQSPPYLRIAGRMELVACQLSLHFAGQLAIGGAISRVALQSHAREVLQTSWERAPGDADLLPAATPVQTSFRQAFVLHLDTLAQAEVALLDGGPVTGAVVGSCGLRARADGQGLQWFAHIAIEPVATTLHLHDPLLGQQTLLRPLLPAMKLLDWSLP